MGFDSYGRHRNARAGCAGLRGRGLPTLVLLVILSAPAGARWSHGGAAAAHEQAEAAVAALALQVRDQGWIVCSARRDHGDWDLFLLRPDGSDRRSVTDTRDFHEAGARFSPDGTRLLYYRLPASEVVDNNTYGTFELVLARSDGGDPVVWGKGYPWASWSPDGNQLACLTPQGIRLIAVATRAVVRQLPRRGLVSQLIWSPDGLRFTGTANGLGPFWNIGCLDAATGQIQALSDTERYNCTPDWRSDAQQVVYARGIIPDQGGNAELWVANLDGRTRRRLYAEPGCHIYGACPSPDGQFVVFTRSAGDLGEVPEIAMALIRWPEAGGADEPPPAVRLDLGPGWEPHWTAKEVLP